VQGRLLTEADLNVIRHLRQEHPQWSRRQLADHLVQQWQWCNEAGRLKDMATRTLLLKLQARGLIDLPPPLKGNGNGQRRARPPSLAQPELLPFQPEPIVGPLSALQPLVLELVVQINGKLRGKISVAAAASNPEIEAIALGDDHITHLLEGQTVKKIIVVPKKLVNIVV